MSRVGLSFLCVWANLDDHSNGSIYINQSSESSELMGMVGHKIKQLTEVISVFDQKEKCVHENGRSGGHMIVFPPQKPNIRCLNPTKIITLLAINVYQTGTCLYLSPSTLIPSSKSSALVMLFQETIDCQSALRKCKTKA